MANPDSLQILRERYRVDAPLARGGTGTLFRGTDTRTGEAVGLKRIVLAGDARGGKDAELPSWRHPHLITYLDSWREAETLWIVTQFHEGRTLAELVESSGPLATDDLRMLCREALLGLVRAHEDGVIHGDLSPANLLSADSSCESQSQSRWVVLDFDLIGQTAQPMFGSIYTLAPELFNGGAKTEQSDLYALGCCYYFAATGRYPFTGETVQEVTVAHLRGEPSAPLNIPPILAQWIMPLLHRDQSLRPRSAKEALATFPL